MKNYVTFIKDESGSMYSLKQAAINDYNANINATVEAANQEKLDTVVSVVSISGRGVKHDVTVSNPHVLKPLTSWFADGGTPLYEGFLVNIAMLRSLPDASNPDVSFLIMATTDGEDTGPKYLKTQLAETIKELQATGRWTFVMRVPKGYRNMVSGLNIPNENIQEWETTVEGMARSTVATGAAMKGFYTARTAGAKSSSSFYTNASNVDTSVLKDITKDVSLYVVESHLNGVEIRDYILTKRQKYLKGSAFYQLTKTEPRVQHTKLIAVRDKTTGKIYSGNDARDMIGLPRNQNARLHPGDHGNFDIFIQSESVNRKLVAGTGVLYWEAIGKPFLSTDQEYLQPKKVNGVVQLPTVAPTNKPTPNPLHKDKKTNVAQTPRQSQGNVQYFSTREVARSIARTHGLKIEDAGNSAPRGKRWYAYA